MTPYDGVGTATQPVLYRASWLLCIQLFGVVILNSAAQLTMKMAAVISGSDGIPALFNIWLFIAALCFVCSFLLWQALLPKKPLSFLHPFCSLPLTLVPIPSSLLFNERLGFTYWLGIALIMLGICCTSSGIRQ